MPSGFETTHPRTVQPVRESGAGTVFQFPQRVLEIYRESFAGNDQIKIGRQLAQKVYRAGTSGDGVVAQLVPDRGEALGQRVPCPLGVCVRP